MEAEEGGEKEEGKKHVDRHDMCHGEKDEGRKEHSGRKKGAPLRETAGRKEIGGQDREEREKGVGKSEGPFAFSECLVREGRDPVEERRLLEIADEVEMGNHVVPEDRHLAGDLRVPSFVRLFQRIGAQVVEEQEIGEGKDKRQMDDPFRATSRQRHRRLLQARFSRGPMIPYPRTAAHVSRDRPYPLRCAPLGALLSIRSSPSWSCRPRKSRGCRPLPRNDQKGLAPPGTPAIDLPQALSPGPVSTLGPCR